VRELERVDVVLGKSSFDDGACRNERKGSGQCLEQVRTHLVGAFRYVDDEVYKNGTIGGGELKTVFTSGIRENVVLYGRRVLPFVCFDAVALILTRTLHQTYQGVRHTNTARISFCTSKTKHKTSPKMV